MRLVAIWQFLKISRKRTGGNDGVVPRLIPFGHSDYVILNGAPNGPR
jgi:hypothetical protein